MVVPDTELICEIMLVAEGFCGAKLLAKKFTTLYNLCKELLSKQVGKTALCTAIIIKLYELKHQLHLSSTAKQKPIMKNY